MVSASLVSAVGGIVLNKWVLLIVALFIISLFGGFDILFNNPAIIFFTVITFAVVKIIGD